MIKRIFCFFFICVFAISFCFADELSDEGPSVSDMMEGVFELVGQVVPSASESAPDGVLDYAPSQDSFDEGLDSSDGASNLVGGNNLLVVNTPTYSLSDIGSALYRAIVAAESEQITEFSQITDITVQPLYTPDNGNTSIPTGSLRYVLSQVIGPYSPVVVQYQYTNGTNTQYLREIMPDYQWMISAAIFALVLYCVFRLWGAILCKR